MFETGIRLEGDRWIVRFDGQDIGHCFRFATACVILADRLPEVTAAQLADLVSDLVHP